MCKDSELSVKVVTAEPLSAPTVNQDSWLQWDKKAKWTGYTGTVEGVLHAERTVKQRSQN